MRYSIQNIDSWHKWFAWYPISIEDELVFWETVERKWDQNKNYRIIDVYDPGDYEGGWEYRYHDN